jgi:hypothetical protein
MGEVPRRSHTHALARTRHNTGPAPYGRAHTLGILYPVSPGLRSPLRMSSALVLIRRPEMKRRTPVTKRNESRSVPWDVAYVDRYLPCM